MSTCFGMRGFGCFGCCDVVPGVGSERAEDEEPAIFSLIEGRDAGAVEVVGCDAGSGGWGRGVAAVRGLVTDGGGIDLDGGAGKGSAAVLLSTVLMMRTQTIGRIREISVEGPVKRTYVC